MDSIATTERSFSIMKLSKQDCGIKWKMTFLLTILLFTLKN